MARLSAHATPSPQPTTYHQRKHHDDERALNIITVAGVNSLPKHAAHAIAAHRHHHPDADADADADAHYHTERPPAKRRKLSIRTSAAIHTHVHAHHPSITTNTTTTTTTTTIKHQTTLHRHFAPQSQSLKPPGTRVTVQEPHGLLVQTINGVQTVLDAGEDDLLLPGPKPQRVTRTPQPAPPPRQQQQQEQQQQKKQEDKRSLRSHDDGPRLKSELAIYFPSYEDIIFDAVRDQEDELLTVDTTLYITDDTPKPTKPDTPVKHSKSNARRTSLNGTAAPPLTPQRSSSNQFNGSPTLDILYLTKSIAADTEDPLTDAHFLKSHKRAERKEKQLRNIEKERAMHEKVQLERLLDGLLGHDWLRVLGITGVTDTEAKKYESKRDYFVAEVRALVDKFRQWKEQEKRQRVGREAIVAHKEVEDEDADSTEGSIEVQRSDLNASAAKQLQQETANAVKSASIKSSSKGKERAQVTSQSSRPATPTLTPRQMLPPRPPSPELPFTSFYSKRHLRDAALSRSRHGRNVTAFGQPLPEMDEYEFQLPDEYVTEEALRANARERRRRKRESTANAPSKAA